MTEHLVSKADAESLERRLVGLLMIRNESDILEDALRKAVVFCDRIFVLDGSDAEEWEKTARILRRFPEVKRVIRDEDTEGPFPVRDGARHYLLKLAREAYGSGRWIAILHGDEFHTRDPRPFLARVDPHRVPVVRVKLCHFFLHQRDERDWQRLRDLPVEKRVTSYMWPGTPEDRFFYDDAICDYDPSRHSLVVPYNSGPRFQPEQLVVKQYNYRDPDQMVKRARLRVASGWQRNHYLHIADRSLFFIPSLHVPGYEPCGWDNVKQPDHAKWSKPRHLEEAPLLSLTEKPGIVFIGGTGRSGTTVTKWLLGSHPSIAAVRPESKFISHDFGVIDLLMSGEAQKFQEFRHRMRDFTPVGEEDHLERAVDNWGSRAHNGETAPYELFDAELDHFEDVLVKRDVPEVVRWNAAAEFIRFLYDRVARAKNAVAWVEQTPRNIRCARELLRLFPDALFVHVFRDPRDVICSLLPQWWGPNAVTEAVPYFRERWNQWKESMEGIIRDGNGDRVVEIRFETMMESAGEHGPSAVLKKLGIPSVEFAIDVKRAHIGRWKDELDTTAARLIEEELGEILAEGGYASEMGHS